MKNGEESNTSLEPFYELTCHIGQETTDLLQGLQDGLQETIESTVPGQTIQKASQVSKSPKFLITRFLRFFWKQKEQTKAKIMKKVKFPRNLDATSIAAQHADVASATAQSAETAPTTLQDADTAPIAPHGSKAKIGYALRAVLTHTGRSADSGHYISWIKDDKGNWWKMDDDKVTSVKEEEIVKLDGGGDWHMAYLCLYERQE